MKEAIILANGIYPTHQNPLAVLNSGLPIICCDGAVTKLDQHNKTPFAIVGDLDSVPQVLKEKYSNCLYPNPDQETNDLTKAVEWTIVRGFKKITILGATGLREDHTLGNISLLANYSKKAEVKILSDHGCFSAFCGTKTYICRPKEQISIFSLTPSEPITTVNLKYPLNHQPLTSWWQGTLNETTDESFTIKSSNATVIIFQNYTSTPSTHK